MHQRRPLSPATPEDAPFVGMLLGLRGVLRGFGLGWLIDRLIARRFRRTMEELDLLLQQFRAGTLVPERDPAEIDVSETDLSETDLAAFAPELAPEPARTSAPMLGHATGYARRRRRPDRALAMPLIPIIALDTAPDDARDMPDEAPSQAVASPQDVEHAGSLPVVFKKSTLRSTRHFALIVPVCYRGRAIRLATGPAAPAPNAQPARGDGGAVCSA